MRGFDSNVLSARSAGHQTSIGGIAPSLRKATTFISILLIAVSTSIVVPSSAFAAKPGPAANVGPAINDWSQCANGSGSALTCVSGWINGDLQGNNSHYHEDDVVPQRALIKIPKGNTTSSHTIAIRYLIRKGSANAHTYDSLATWNVTVSNANACQSLSPCPAASGTASKVGIPDDPSIVNPVGTGVSNVTSAHMLPIGAQREMWLYGGTITGMAYSPATLNASTTGTDVDRTLVVTFSATGSTNQDRYLELLFGGHLAAGPTGATGSPRGWGTGLGAANVNGGPYHVIMDALDGSGGGQDNNIQASAILPLGAPAFTVTKVVKDLAGNTITSASPGQTIQYVITVTNTGTAAGSTPVTDTYDSRLTNVTSITQPAGATAGVNSTANHQVTWSSSGTIAAGGTATFTFNATIPSSFSTSPPDPTPSPYPCTTSQFDIVNDVSVTGSAAHTDTCVGGGPSFTVAKRATNPTTGATITSANPGDTIRYVITVTNTGSSPGSTPVTDTYDSRLTNITNITQPAGASTGVNSVANHQVTWASSGTIAAGGTATFTFDATIPLTFSGTPNSTDPCAGTFDIINSVSVTGDSDQTDTCVSASATFTVTKRATNPTTGATITSASPGDTIRYVITVTNTGNAPGSTPVTDTYDSRLTNITNITQPAGASTGVNSVANHQVTWASSGTIAAGGAATFTFDATIPTTFSGTPNVGNPCAGTFDIINQVNVTGDSDQTDTCVAANPSFTVTKIVRNAAGQTITSANPGDTITYVITVTNNGNASGSTTVTDTYDSRLTNIGNFSKTPTSQITPTVANPITWDSGTLAGGGGQLVITFTAQIPQNFTGNPNPGNAQTCPGSFDIINMVSVTGSSASTDTCVSASPSFTVTKVVKNAAGNVITAANPGDTITYVITVTNNGHAAGSTTVTDTYDSRLTNIGNFSKTPTSQITPTVANPITWDSGTLAGGGGQLVITFTATIPASFTGTPDNTTLCPGTYDIINRVAVTGSSDQTDTCVSASPTFSVAKKATNPTTGATITSANPGDTIRYVITVTNTGTAPGATPVTDTYDSRLTNITNITQPAGASTGVNSTANHQVTWASSGTINPGASATFTFDATIPSSFVGTPNSTNPCAGSFDIINQVNVTGSSDHTDTCVATSPAFTVTKVAKNAAGQTITTATPGQTITYVITVTNNGSGPGSTPVTDHYDSRLTNVGNPIPATGVVDTTAHTVTWADSGTIQPGSSATFSFQATIPANFVGDPTSSGPCAGSFDIINTVSVTGNGTQNDLCVTATPNLSLVKSADKTQVTGGDQVTYTLTYSNTGSASSEATTITETIPANTSYASCSNNCTTSGNPVTTVTWSIGSVPGHSSGFVTLTVNVLNSVGCSVCNTASISSRSFNGGTPVNSNTLCINSVPVDNPAGAHANGSAFGLYVHEGLLVPVDVTLSPTSSSRSGLGVDSHSNSLLNTGVPGIVNVDLLSTTSNSVVSAHAADQTTTAETAGLNVLNGLVTAQVVRGVATTHADGSSSSFSSIGSTIVGLRVNGVAYDQITPGLQIDLPKLVFGNGSYVKVYERTGSTSGPAAGQNSGGTYAADLTVNMIHVHITKLLLPLGGTALLDVNVSHAVAHSDFPQTTVCTPVPKQSVSGHAFIAYENTDPSILPILYGFASIPSTGGHDFKTLNTLDVPPGTGSVLHLGVTDDDVNGQPGATSSNSSAYAEAANVCLLKMANGSCTIGATAVKSEAASTANASGASSTDAGTQFVALQVAGQTIPLPVPPNTVINLPGLGYVVLNEQFCDGATAIAPGPVTPCAGTTHSGLTVRAIHVVLTVPPVIPGLSLGLEVIVAEAHSDATWIR